MRQLTEKEVEQYHGIFSTLVDKFPEERRALVNGMLAGPIGEMYMTAPASTREDFHSSYPGGLLVHSLNVVQHLKKLADSLCKDRWPNSTLAFVGLFHDFGKCGDGSEPYYVINPSDNGRARGFNYEVNRACTRMPTSERGLYILQDHGIRLSSDEYLAIRLNDGQYVPENKYYAMGEPDLALLVHWADMWSASQEKLPPG